MKNQAIKLYRWGGGGIAPHILYLLMPWPYNTWKKTLSIQHTGGWVDSRADVGTAEKENLCPSQESDTIFSVVQPVAWPQ